jgi:hypothetical protein
MESEMQIAGIAPQWGCFWSFAGGSSLPLDRELSAQIFNFRKILFTKNNK